MRRVTSSFDLRYLHRSELELMLELAGFAEWRVYGRYDLGTLFASKSVRLDGDLALVERFGKVFPRP